MAMDQLSPPRRALIVEDEIVIALGYKTQCPQWASITAI
jgi:hypothetical protein